jgi:RIO-like serine/threonine protein kinase
MSQTQLRITILRAALRCARHRREVTREALIVRVDCTESELDAALAELARDGLVHAPSDARLTMAGLAVAVATIRPLVASRPVQRARSAA